MPYRHVAFYARVSTEGQARDNTIASQITALRERIAADGGQLEPDDAYVDEGSSGSVLVRPALERLRDAAAAGRIGQLYVLAPDRLARRHAHQALLMEEFRRAGVEVTFLNRPIGAGRRPAAPDPRGHRRIRARPDPGARSAGTAPCCAVRLGERPRRRSLWVSLCHPRPGWRN